MNTFKVGDTVSYIGSDIRFRGALKVVTDITVDCITFKYEDRYYRDYYYNWTLHSRPSINELNKLIDYANRGEQAIQKIMKEYPGQVVAHFSSLQSKVDKDWRMEYSYKLKSSFEIFFVNNNKWEVKLDEDNTKIKVGCARFDVNVLKIALSSLCNGDNGEHALANYNDCTSLFRIRGNRNGVWSQMGSITWEEADKILAALKESE